MLCRIATHGIGATYRGHHHAMARGASPAECLAELMSKATGLCQAKGGSMHLTKASAGMLGSYAIVGAHLPIAAGAAWSAKLRGTGTYDVEKKEMVSLLWVLEGGSRLVQEKSDNPLAAVVEWQRDAGVDKAAKR